MNNKITKKEANYKAQTTDSQHCSVCTMFREPNNCTLVIGAVRPGGWCKFFNRAAIGKANTNMTTEIVTMDKELKLFMPFGKAEKQSDGTVIVHGYASTQSKDSDGEVVALKAVKAALPSYMAWGNIREMHRLSAVGKAKDAKMDDEGLFLTARIVDKEAVRKVNEGIYQGFSIGGRKLAKVGDIITEIDMNEISIVDRPANPDCRFAIAKSMKQTPDAGAFLVKVRNKTPEQRAIKQLSKAVESLSLVDSNKSPKDDEVQNNKIGAPAVAAGGSTTMALADDNNTDATERKKAKVAKKKAKKMAKKARKADALQKRKALIAKQFNLTKSVAPSFLALAAESVDHALGDVLPRHDGLNVGSHSQEGRTLHKRNKSTTFVDEPFAGEAPSFLDLGHASNDTLTLGEGFAMTATNDETQLDMNDPLVKAVVDMLQKRAPSKKDLFAKAFVNMKKLNKARKEAKGAIGEAHGMMKAMYLAKLAKANKAKPNDDADDDKSEDVMKALQKAYNAVENVGTFRKAAMSDLQKAVGSPGHEATDGNAFFEVPSGVKSLNQNELVTAGPGGKERGSNPFELVLENPTPAGKADVATTLAKFVKNGSVPLEVVELVTRLTKAEGEAEALRSLPSRTGNARPRGFDMSKLAGAGSDLGKAANDREAIFKGVNVDDLNGIDESRHMSAAGKAIGNYILSGRFSKSVMDQDFHGSVGG